MNQPLDRPGTHQFALLGERRFLPLFGVSVGGAFNDNFYKSALLILFTYGGIDRWGLSVDVVNNLVAATLIVPFLLFAPSAGQLADKFEKARLIRYIKLGELAIVALGALALWLNSAALLMLVLFLIGTQSACFSPLKYGILPQHVDAHELTGANGLLHTGTSLAIFLGMIAGTLALEVGLVEGRWIIAIGALLIAGAGWWASRRVPRAALADAGLSLHANPWRQTRRVLGYARENPLVFWCIVGSSWYWFLGSVYLTQLPNFTRTTLFGSPAAVSTLLTLFLLGICAGALLCEKISRRRVEPALVPLGALLVVIFGADLALAGMAFAEHHALARPDQLYTLGQLWQMPRWWRVVIDVMALGLAGGLYLIPLTALVQERTRAARRSQVLAAGNVFSALFMIGASVTGLIGLGVVGLSIPQLFLTVVVMHLGLMSLIFWRRPEFRRRFAERFLPGR